MMNMSTQNVLVSATHRTSSFALENRGLAQKEERAATHTDQMPPSKRLTDDEIRAQALEKHRTLVASVTLETDNTLDPVVFQSTPKKDVAEAILVGMHQQKLLDIYMSNAGAKEQGLGASYQTLIQTPTEKALEKYKTAQNQHKPETLPADLPPVVENPESHEPIPLAK